MALFHRIISFSISEVLLEVELIVLFIAGLYFLDTNTKTPYDVIDFLLRMKLALARFTRIYSCTRDVPMKITLYIILVQNMLAGDFHGITIICEGDPIW